MHSKNFAALFLFFAAQAVYGTPMADFFERMHEEPVLTYQCFRNATSFEDPSATDLTVLWDGGNLPEDEAVCNVSYSEPGSQGQTRFEVNAEYVPEDDNAILTGEGMRVELYLLLPPYNGQAYYFREVVTPSGPISMKIYDTNPTCENALALRTLVCPEPCSLESTR
ncbi:uncharacterized protein LOC144094654 [Amblyomma americanum]